MKNKGKYFNFGLFRDGFSQLKWIGLVGLCISCLLTLLASGQVIAVMNMGYGDAESMIDYGSLSTVFSSSFRPLMILFVPAMMISALGFNNKRSASDFYHALPQKRSCIYLSYCASVFAWLLLILCGVIVTQLCGIGYQMIGSGRDNILLLAPEMIKSMLINVLYMLAGGILAMGAMALAMSITGTLFTNVVAFLIILFLPRMLISIVVNGFYRLAPMIPESTGLNVVLNSSYQLFYSSFASPILLILEATGILRDIVYQVPEYYNSLYYAPYAAEVNQWIPIIYSTVLGCLYLILGGILLHRRKSEAAERSSVKKCFQILLRMAIPLAISLPATLNLTQYLLHPNMESAPVGQILLLYGISLIVYFLFELITTRKFKSVAKSALQLPALIIVNVILCVVMVGVVNHVMNDVPKPDEIDKIYVKSANTGYYFNYPEEVNEILNEMPLTGETVKETVSEALRSELHWFKDTKAPENIISSESWQCSWVRICMKSGRSMERNISFTANEWETLDGEIVKALADNEEKIALPDEEEVTGFYLPRCAWDFGSSRLRELYASLREELDAQGLSLSWYLGKQPQAENTFDIFEVGSTQYDIRLQLPISPSTPKTLALLANMGNERWKNYDFDQFAEKVKSRDSLDYLVISFILYDKNSTRGLEYDNVGFSSKYEDLTMEQLENLRALLDSCDSSQVSADENLLFLVTKYDIEGSKSQGHWYNLSDQELALFRQYVPYGRAYIVEPEQIYN